MGVQEMAAKADVQADCPCSRQPVRRKYGRGRWVLAAAGLVSLIWFVVRVVPKPSRAAYPCQRIAAPLASGFLAWVLGLAASAAFFRRARHFLRKSRYVIAGISLAAGVLSIWWSAGVTSRSATAGVFVPSDPANSPMGTAVGIHPGRVVWVHDPNATSWDGSTGYWSDDTNTNQAVVNDMFSRAIRWLTGQISDANAWVAIFRHFNERHGKGAISYQAGEKIAIKINMVNCGDHGNPGNKSYNSPQLIEAVLKQLVTTVGVQPTDITVYDASNCIPGTIYNRCSVGILAGVRFVDNLGGDGRIQAQRDSNVMVHHADSNVPQRWLPTCVTQAAYIINLAHLKAHYLTGVTLCAKNHFGSTWVQADPCHSGWQGREDFWPGNDIHSYINAYDTTNGQSAFKVPARPMGSYNPLVELMGHRDLGKKTVLFVIDGLFPGKNPSAPISESPPWQSYPFNGDWMSSIFVSQDNVAIDSVALDFLRCEPTISCVADANDYSTADDYLHEAALADDPCSGSFYNPDGTGRLTSLGAHEHWNNTAEKKYSRNLAAGCGIELVCSLPPARIPGDLQLDGDVDLFDLAILTAGWLQTRQPLCGGDLNNDSYVDFLDFARLAPHWGQD